MPTSSSNLAVINLGSSPLASLRFNSWYLTHIQKKTRVDKTIPASSHFFSSKFVGGVTILAFIEKRGSCWRIWTGHWTLCQGFTAHHASYLSEFSHCKRECTLFFSFFSGGIKTCLGVAEPIAIRVKLNLLEAALACFLLVRCWLHLLGCKDHVSTLWNPGVGGRLHKGLREKEYFKRNQCGGHAWTLSDESTLIIQSVMKSCSGSYMYKMYMYCIDLSRLQRK